MPPFHTLRIKSQREPGSLDSTVKMQSDVFGVLVQREFGLGVEMTIEKGMHMYPRYELGLSEHSLM
jgi:hypothetical protein